MKRSWLIPRFSLSNLLMLMVVVGLSLAWYDQRRKLGEQAEVIEKQRLEIKRVRVKYILANDHIPDVEKVIALGEFVKLGDRVEGLQEWCGARHDIRYDNDGPLTLFDDCDLAVRCRSDRTIFSFGWYRVRWVTRDSQESFYHALVSEDESPVPAHVSDPRPSKTDGPPTPPVELPP